MRERQKLFLKGDRCYSEKCALTRREKLLAPGQHGARRRKLSEYGTQMREKQKARRFYGVLESQFAKYYEMAVKKSGITGENLLQILESRLDNVVYRAGFAMSRPEARQLVRHGHFTVNGSKVNIPSYLVKAGDVIAIKEKSLSSEKIKAILEKNAGRPVPKWLDVDFENKVAKVITLAAREDIDLPVAEHMIVELYSK
jgi:small subunit ribosomal protein S4